MALIGTIRQRAKLLVGVVTLGLIVFIGRELVSLNPLANKKDPIIGMIGKQKITLSNFQKKLAEMQEQYYYNYGRSPKEDEVKFLQQETFKEIKQSIIYQQICHVLGLTVTEEELVDMVQGSHIHPTLKNIFTKPNTAEFDKASLLNYLKQLSQLPKQNQMQWYQFEKQLQEMRCQEKFNNLVKASVFVTTAEAKQKLMMEQTTVDFSYLFIPYQSISNEAIEEISEHELINYLNKHASDYQAKETKEIKYIDFPIMPSEMDKEAFQQELLQLKKDFEVAQEAALFASLNTEGNTDKVILFAKENELPAPIMRFKANLQAGNVIGPVEVNGQHVLYKVVHVDMEEQQKKYKLAYIQKEIAPSDRTKEVIFQQADIFVSQVKDLKSFEKLAQEKKIAIQVAQIEKEATQVGTIKHAREFVRWLYTDAKIGKVSRLFEIGNHYVVAVPIAHHPAGSLVPIETVKESIMNKILNQRKSAIIKSKLLPLLELPLEKIAAAYDTNLSINVATALKMNDKQIPAIGMAAKTICSAFGLATGQQSRPIVDESGVFIIRINKREMPANVNATLEKEKTRLLLRAQQWQPYQIMEAMEELLHVKDFRYKYY